MKTYYVLSGNQVLGHFKTLRESWTLEDAVELAGVVTTQEALEHLYMMGAACVYPDETDCYVFDVNGCRVLDFEPDAGVLELCDRIRYSREWDTVDACILCVLAGLNDEWLNANGENFENVVCAAAEKLGGVIL